MNRIKAAICTVLSALFLISPVIYVAALWKIGEVAGLMLALFQVADFEAIRLSPHAWAIYAGALISVGGPIFCAVALIDYKRIMQKAFREAAAEMA